jgi:rfaE bifunctional protein kinase chain/domain
MGEKEIKELFKNFDNLKALVIGDVMVDSYLWGRVDRISPEAPVPVVQVTRKEARLGGAANVAVNIAALGATPIICALGGNDANGELLKDLIVEQGMSAEGILASNDRPTTVKTRVISSHQHVVRVDEESLSPLSKKEESAFIRKVFGLIDTEKPDVIVFEDYNKGVLTKKVIRSVIEKASELGIPTSVDPKKQNFFAYKNVDLFKPNLKELVEGLKVDINKEDISSLEKAVEELQRRINNKISLITLSEMGVFISGESGNTHIPAHLRKISDVSGAGDTVVSVASLCLASKTPEKTIAALSNLAGGLVCEKVGVVPIDKQRLLEEAIANQSEL